MRTARSWAHDYLKDAGTPCGAAPTASHSVGCNRVHRFMKMAMEEALCTVQKHAVKGGHANLATRIFQMRTNEI